jgi:hypothetical protein
MNRTLRDGVRVFGALILLCALHGSAAAADAKQGAAKTEAGGLDGSLPLVIGGAITLGVLGFGFILLSGSRQPAKPPVTTEADPYYDQVPPDVVPAASPVRYLIGPAILLVLLAVFVPLAYSLYAKFSDFQLITPAEAARIQSQPQPAIDFSTFKPVPPIDWQSLQLKMVPPPTITFQQPPITFQQPRTQIQQVPPPINVPTRGQPRR